MIKLKHILKETDAEVQSIFGDIAFGDDSASEIRGYKFLNLQGKKGQSEKNTKLEAEIMSVLVGWTSRTTTLRADYLASKEELFRKAAKVFPVIFKPETPNRTEVYRGLKHTQNKTIQDSLKGTTPKDYKKVKHGGNIYYSYKKPINYEPHMSVQSWSSNVKSAAYFANAALLTTKQDDDFLFNQTAMSIFYGRGMEDEILHFGKSYTNPVYISIGEIQYEVLMGIITLPDIKKL